MINEKIERVIALLNERKFIEAKRILKELSSSIIEKENRLGELEEFSSEVKRRFRSAGKSQSIPVGDLEDIFVKYKIQMGGKT